ncbi:ubiquitin domain-containing protein UBFD1-like [Sycon ciliatum]|uniref:ubiquitin domain-containing protein UBFD1-like n=1 Tax=Sycon ciliatum TaxID=27933 RepID=UPI0031F64BD0
MDTGTAMATSSVSVTTAEDRHGKAAATDTAPASDCAAMAAAAVAADGATFRVVFKKQTHNVTMGTSCSVGELKAHAEALTGVPVSMMKLMFKGMLKDDNKTLEAVGIKSGSKLMVVGSTVDDVLAVTAPVAAASASASSSASAEKKSTKLCDMEKHKKIISKGKPEDATIGIIGQHDPLPQVPLSGMVNSINGKVRLTFKLEQDELWIGTKVRTDKIPMSQIQNIVSEPITGHSDYHVMGLQLGSTEQSRYWVYWVPSQFVNSIRRTVLGHL